MAASFLGGAMWIGSQTLLIFSKMFTMNLNIHDIYIPVDSMVDSTPLARTAIDSTHVAFGPVS